MKIIKNKLHHEEIFNIVRDELNKTDPLGVVLGNDKLGDEYDLENREITTIVKSCTNYRDLAKKMCEIFIATTEMKLKPEQFYECAKNILERTKN